MQKKLHLTLLFFVVCVVSLVAQETATKDFYSRNKGSGLLAQVRYGYHFPGADLDDRFGNSSSIGLGFGYITEKSNIIFNGVFDFYYGFEVKEDALAPLRNDQGIIIGNNHTYADIQQRNRGFYTGLSIGKIFNLSPNQPRSGILVSLGAGIFQHKIRIQDDPLSQVPQLDKDYKKGYDHLTNGFALQEFVGYSILSRNGFLNFYAGIEFTQAFTQNRRSVNFVTREQDTAKRFDSLTGLRIGWILPFYLGNAYNEEIYY